MNPEVLGIAPEYAAGHLERVAEEDAFVRMDGVVAEIQVRRQFDVRQRDSLQGFRRILYEAPVVERDAELQVVEEAGVKPPERSIEPCGPLKLAIAQDRVVLGDRYVG